MKNQKIWPHWDSTALWQQWLAIKLSPHEKEHALATLPNTPWPSNALDLACLTSAQACSFTPAGTEFLTLSSTTHMYTCEAFGQPVPHYPTSQLCIHPSLWRLEGASGTKVILKHHPPPATPMTAPTRRVPWEEPHSPHGWARHLTICLPEKVQDDPQNATNWCPREHQRDCKPPFSTLLPMNSTGTGGG